MSLILDHVNYIYGGDTALAVHALKDVNLVIPDGQLSASSDIPVPASPHWCSISMA